MENIATYSIGPLEDMRVNGSSTVSYNGTDATITEATLTGHDVYDGVLKFVQYLLERQIKYHIKLTLKITKRVHSTPSRK
jgi:hypothetical protein